MSNPASIFIPGLMRLAARRSLSDLSPRHVWRAAVRHWFELRRQRREAAVLEAVMQLDDHLLQDIGAPDDLREQARVLRDRREQPFSPTSPRGIESASRRVGW